jgi:hypothetical protein
MLKINREILANSMVQFANRKPGFDGANYAGYYAAYKSDYNRYKRDADFNRNFDYKRLLNLLKMNTDDEIRSAFTAFCGRLSIKDDMGLSYCTGQYFPTEYQAALRAVIERLLGK